MLLNETHKKKLFYLIQYKNGWLAASDLFDMFTQSIKFYYTFYYHVSWVQMFEKFYNSKNEWLLLPAPSSKIWVGFCLNTGKRFFFRGFILKPTERV